jgi:type I restriction-modification system DNA methylase subunit
MTTTLPTIQNHLNLAKQPNSMRDLFCQTLGWGKGQGAGQTMVLGAPVSQTLTAKPIAQLGTLPVFQIDWPDTTLPNVTQRRAVYHKLSQTALEHLMCYVTSDGKRLAFVWARDRGGKRVELRTLPYEASTHARTTIERLSALAFSFDEFDMFGAVRPSLVIERLNTAFDVEAVTREFFTHYREAFQAAEQSIKGVSGEARRLFTQKLFNRLMFIVFLERKGWLTFGGRTDYLRALWQAHLKERTTQPQVNFYADRLKLLFFMGLNNPHEANLMVINRGGYLGDRIGQVPYLNGGLFEEEADDKNGAIVVPDDALDEALTELFYRFNFTVSESTPLDIEVAVDPEMLGKVFEELVTGRHESGSYYTPRPIVAFMCREGLKGYLSAKLPKEKPEVIARFVDERGAAELRDPEAALAALKSVKVCDPACGSGAYLLGMLQELLSLRAGLFAAKHVDATTTYQRKLEIIQDNIYGVDLDQFAINIARLRLWLSLVVDYEGDNPPPLPNLDFKVEAGDSLAAPDPSGGLQLDMFRQQQIDDYFALKERYLESHHGEKQTLKKQVEAKKREIVTWARPRGGVAGFDWAVEFAEVFAEGGFDIVMANPPYVRQELLGKDYKESILKQIYSDVYIGTADLYVYFFARAQQLVKQLTGFGCFISSNKWLRASYGEKLCQNLLDKQDFRLVVDFGELPVFETASTFPAIFLWRKAAREQNTTRWVLVKDLEECYTEGILEYLQRNGESIPATQFGVGQPRIISSTKAVLVSTMQAKGMPLRKVVAEEVYRGITTGYNDAFVIDQETYDHITDKDLNSRNVIKPLLSGDDIRRYEIHFRDKYLIFSRRGINIRKYPSILNHLEEFRTNLTPKISSSEKKGRKPGLYQWYEIQDSTEYYKVFDAPKIVSSKMASEPRFVLDTEGHYLLNTTYCIAKPDWFLLGVLNSNILAAYLRQILVTFGDPDAKGRTEPRTEDLLDAPIPRASVVDQELIGKLAQEAQKLHFLRRSRTEKFLVSTGSARSRSSGRNPLEQPWTLDSADFTKKAKGIAESILRETQAETIKLASQIYQLEAEIDERVARLYGLGAADLKAIQGE